MRMIMMLAVFGGCTMSSSSGSVREDLRDAQNEEQLHITESRAAPDLSSLVSEVNRYSANMTVILDDMRDHMSSVQHCSGMNVMMNMRDGMQIEVVDHQTMIHAMRDLTIARAEDEHHYTVMIGMLGDMDSQLGGMHCSGM